MYISDGIFPGGKSVEQYRGNLDPIEQQQPEKAELCAESVESVVIQPEAIAYAISQIY